MITIDQQKSKNISCVFIGDFDLDDNDCCIDFKSIIFDLLDKNINHFYSNAYRSFVNIFNLLIYKIQKKNYVRFQNTFLYHDVPEYVKNLQSLYLFEVTLLTGSQQNRRFLPPFYDDYIFLPLTKDIEGVLEKSITNLINKVDYVLVGTTLNEYDLMIVNHAQKLKKSVIYATDYPKKSKSSIFDYLK